MGDVHSTDLKAARSVLVVCRNCKTRMTIGRMALVGLDKAGVKTMGHLKEAAFCYLCEHGGEDAQNLRFHAEWIGQPGNVIRLVPPEAKRAA